MNVPSLRILGFCEGNNSRKEDSIVVLKITSEESVISRDLCRGCLLSFNEFSYSYHCVTKISERILSDTYLFMTLLKATFSELSVVSSCEKGVTVSMRVLRNGGIVSR